MNAQPRSSHQSITCHRCLEHTPQTCPFRQTECHKCKKVGHIAKACKTRSPRTEKSHKQTTKATNYMEQMQDTTRQGIPSQDSDNSYDLFTLSSNGQEPILVSVTLNQTPIQMEVDTGASLSLLNKQTFDIIANKNHTTLKTTDVHFKTYTGETIEILGAAELTITYGEQTKQLLVHVVAGNGPNLMGRDCGCAVSKSQLGNSTKCRCQMNYQGFWKNISRCSRMGLEHTKGERLHSTLTQRPSQSFSKRAPYPSH